MVKLLLLLFFVITLYSSELHLSTSSNPSRLNPILATDSSSSQIADFIFNSLVKYDKDGKEIIGDLAKKFYYEDNRTVIFELRSDVTWHDGEKFSSKDVVFTYNLIISPKITTPYSANFRVVQSVEAIDDHKIRVVYKEPYFKALESWMLGILPEHILKDEKNIMGSDFNKNPIGTGSYKLESLEFSKAIELAANEDYFEGAPKIKKIYFHVISDPMTRFLMLKDGAIDIDSLDAMQYERQLHKEFFEKYRVIESIAHAYTYLGFNLRLEKFQDKRVRRALSLAIDREELINILFFKHATPCSGPFLPGSIGFNESVKVPTRDLKKAKELLAEAGYDENHPLEFELSTSNSNSIRPYAAQILQQQLSQIGVKVTLRIMEWQAFLNMVVFPRKFETVLLGWSLSLSPDPYLLWHSDNDKAGGFNFIGYHSKKVDQLIDKMQYTIERNELAKVQKEIFASITEDDPYLFLFIPNDITVADKRITNIEPTINGIWHNYIKWEKN